MSIFKNLKGVCAIIACAIIAVMAVTPALATDGVIEINQAKVNAAGGFPYVISQSGSYRLTSNLTLTDPTKDAIEIGVSNVTLDLNGFTILGPATCTLSLGPGPVASCTPAGMGTGVTITQTAQNSGGLSNIRVMNGTIGGMPWCGIYLPDSSPVLIENIRAIGNGTTGIAVGGGQQINDSKILNCISERNGNNGFELLHGIVRGLPEPFKQNIRPGDQQQRSDYKKRIF